MLLSHGDFERAKALYTEGISLGKELGNEPLIAWQLMGLARVAVAKAQLTYATRLYSAAEARFDVNKGLSPKELEDYERTIGRVRAQLGKQVFAAAWKEGRMMTLERLLEAPEPESTPDPIFSVSNSTAVAKAPSESSHDNNLTIREMEVLRLVAQGWTDAQIAEELVISRRTVNAHLTSIYSKIKVSSRSAATRYAIDRKLV